MQERDVRNTLELLKLLTRGGADVNIRKNNGEVVLHTAARRGPLQATWLLLLNKATHDIVDDRLFTPESAATRAGKKDCAALLANWAIVWQKYFDSEFVQEWMHRLCDPDGEVGNDLTVSEVLAQIRIEEHEARTAVRISGGHTLIDEIVTGPVMSAKQREQIRLTQFSAESANLTSTLEGGSRDIQRALCPKRESQASRAEVDVGGTDGVDHFPKKTRSMLGMDIGLFLAKARDDNNSGLVGGAAGRVVAYSRVMAKENLKGRKSRWPGRRGNENPSASETGVSGADPLGRPMTTSQRRRVAALEIAEDGGGCKH